jgi:hypothetical protein
MSPTVDEPIDVFEFSANGNFAVSDSANSFSLDNHDMIQDFERSDVLETVAQSHDPMSFQAESNSLLGVDISGAGEGESWYSSNAYENTQADQRPSAELQSPSDNGVVHKPADFSMHSEEAYEGVRESSETGCATLLAVDEPLGELFDEAVSVDQLSLFQPSTNDSLGFEFTEAESAGLSGSEATQFNLVETCDESSKETSFNFVENAPQEMPAAVAETPMQETATEMPESTFEMHEATAQLEEATAEKQEPVAVMQEPAMQETAAEMHEAAAEIKAESPLPEAINAFHDAGGDLDWTTPRAATQSTAELDSVVMPVQTDFVQPDASVEAEPAMTETSDESGPTGAHTWTEEETRFTPIDIEAVAIDDASVEIESTTHTEPDAGTGFVVSSVLAEEPPAKVESPVDDALEEARSAAVASDLSAAAIDQIVRRVLSQMSESVVREVAWEVVPDCVERVVEQLTRESLSKRP